MATSRTDLLNASSMKSLGHVALKLGLNRSLAEPMTVILGKAQRGRMARELEGISSRHGGRDLATLLAYGDDALATRSKQPMKAKLLGLARSHLVRALEARPSTPSEPGENPQPMQQMRSWADKNHVGPLMDLSIYTVLNPIEPQLFSGTVDQVVEKSSFETLLCDPDLNGRSRLPPERLQRLRTTAWKYLRTRAEEAQTALDHAESSGITRAPDDDDRSTRAELIRHALDARQQLIADVVPRPLNRIRARPFTIKDATPPTFEYSEEPADRYAFAPRVSIPLVVDKPWTNIKCTDHKGPCDHKLAALEALLETLQNGDDEAVAQIVDPIALPPWSRGLKALDTALTNATLEEEEDANTAEAVVSWGVTLAGNRPQVHPWLQVPTKSGGLGKARRTKPDKLLDSDYAIDADDQHVAELLELYQLMHDPTSARASRILQRILQNLVGHPRVLRQPDGVPFTVRRAELTLVTVRGEGNVRLLPSIDDETWTLDDFAKRFQRRVGRLMTYTTEDALILVEVPPAFASVVEVLHQHDFQMPERALPELVKRLPRFAPRVPVTFDREVPRVSVSARRHLVVRLSPRGSGLTATVAIQPMADGPVHVPGEGPAEVLHVNEEGQLQATLRDRGAEITWAKTRVQALMPDADADHRPWRYALSTPEDALTTLERLQAAEDVSVQWPSRHPWKISSATANGRGLRIEVRDRPDWFGIGGDIDVDGQRVPLNNLIDAIQRNDSFVEVQQGQWAKIGEDLRQRLRDLEPHLRREKDELAVTPAAAEALESLGTASAEFVRSVRWKANLDRLEAAKNADDTPPPDLKATLRDYQLAGFRWMNRLATWGLGACLADDMGLGKTLQALAILAARAPQGPQLVVAPTSVVYNWVREAERFAPSLDIRLYIGSDRSEILDDLGPQTLIVTSYGLVVRDVQTLSSLALTTVVLDEAQAIKNAQSQRSIAVRQLQADWKLALSGTPVENHLGELWSLFDAIAPGLLGSWTNFRDRFVAPIERDGNRARAEALSRLLRPFVLRRTKQEVAKELPARTSINLDIVLTDAERAVYDQARTTAVAELAGASSDGRGRFAALAALTRLRQLACHPRLVDPSSELPSSKLGRLMTLVRALRTTKQRALLFSQFTQHLALVREALEEAGFNYLYLDGQTPVEERARRVEAFQEGDVGLFLISLKAGGTGLTLTGADTVIHLDPWWNPAVEDQATDRAHRIGQTKPVTVYRLVARATIEEAIVQLHESKRELVAQVLGGTQTASNLSTDELIDLIRTGA